MMILSQSSDPNWVDLLDRFGLPILIVAFFGILVWMAFKAFLPLWTKRYEATNKLTFAMSEELPKIASNTERVAANTEAALEQLIKHSDAARDTIERIEKEMVRHPDLAEEVKKLIEKHDRKADKIIDDLEVVRQKIEGGEAYGS